MNDRLALFEEKCLRYLRLCITVAFDTVAAVKPAASECNLRNNQKWGVLLSILSKSFSMKTFVESNLQSMSFGTFSVDVIRLVPISVHLLKVPFC